MTAEALCETLAVEQEEYTNNTEKLKTGSFAAGDRVCSNIESQTVPFCQ